MAAPLPCLARQLLYSGRTDMNAISISAPLQSEATAIAAPGLNSVFSVKPDKATPDFAQTVRDAVAKTNTPAHTSTDSGSNPKSGSSKAARPTKPRSEPQSKPAAHIENVQATSFSYIFAAPAEPTPEIATNPSGAPKEFASTAALNGTGAGTPSQVQAGIQSTSDASGSGSQSAAGSSDSNSTQGVPDTRAVQLGNEAADETIPGSIEAVAGNVPAIISAPPNGPAKQLDTKWQAFATVPTALATNNSELDGESIVQGHASQSDGSNASGAASDKKSADDASVTTISDANQPGNHPSISNVLNLPANLAAGANSASQAPPKSSVAEAVPSRSKLTDAAKPPSTNSSSEAPKANSQPSSVQPSSVDLSQPLNLDLRRPDPALVSLNWRWAAEPAKPSSNTTLESNARDSNGDATQQQNGDPNDASRSGGNSMPSISSISVERHSTGPVGTTNPDAGAEANSVLTTAAAPAMTTGANAIAVTASPRDSVAATQPQAAPMPLPSASQLRSADLPETQYVNVSSLVEGIARGEMHLSMQTERLGAVELHTSVHGDQVGAIIAVEKHDMQSLLNNALPQLHQALSDKNLLLQQVTIQHGLSDAAAQGSASHSKQDSGNRQSGYGSTNGSGSSGSSATGGSSTKGEAGIYDLRGRLSVRV
jgi:hypothetical protein